MRECTHTSPIHHITAYNTDSPQRAPPQYWPEDTTRAFIASNWDQWEAESPGEWFADPRWKRNLPEWAWPDAEKREAFLLNAIDVD